MVAPRHERFALTLIAPRPSLRASLSARGPSAPLSAPFCRCRPRPDHSVGSTGLCTSAPFLTHLLSWVIPPIRSRGPPVSAWISSLCVWFVQHTQSLLGDRQQYSQFQCRFSTRRLPNSSPVPLVAAAETAPPAPAGLPCSSQPGEVKPDVNLGLWEFGRICVEFR